MPPTPPVPDGWPDLVGHVRSPMDRIYLDHAATTPIDPRVLDAMTASLRADWGNPSSGYREGRAGRRALDEARRTVAGILDARPSEVIWTAGGSESDNLAIRGVIDASHRGSPHIVASAIEHHAVLHTIESLVRAGRCRA